MYGHTRQIISQFTIFLKHRLLVFNICRRQSAGPSQMPVPRSMLPYVASGDQGYR